MIYWSLGEQLERVEQPPTLCPQVIHWAYCLVSDLSPDQKAVLTSSVERASPFHEQTAHTQSHMDLLQLLTCLSRPWSIISLDSSSSCLLPSQGVDPPSQCPPKPPPLSFLDLKIKAVLSFVCSLSLSVSQKLVPDSKLIHCDFYVHCSSRPPPNRAQIKVTSNTWDREAKPEMPKEIIYEYKATQIGHNKRLS